MASPPDTPNALKAAEAAISKGDLQAALDAIAPLETLDPIPEACHRLAVRIAAAQDDPTEALRRLDLAIEAAGRTTCELQRDDWHRRRSWRRGPRCVGKRV